MTLPQRINQHELRGNPKLRSPAHRSWIREHHCSVPGCFDMPIECAHVRRASNAGTGIKSSDAYCVSLCAAHHRESHAGEQSFERKYKLNLMSLAEEFFRRSPFKSRLDDPYR